MAAYITALNCVCCVVYITYDLLCSGIMCCPAWQTLGLLLIVLCSGLSVIVIKPLLLLLLFSLHLHPIRCQNNFLKLTLFAIYCTFVVSRLYSTEIAVDLNDIYRDSEFSAERM